MPIPSTSKNGFAMISVLLSAAMAAIVSTALMSMVSYHSSAERGVASNAELSQFGIDLAIILERKESCAKSGLIGLSIDPATVSLTPTPSPLTLHLPTSAGPGAAFAQVGAVIGSTRKITELGFSALTPLGSVSLGTEYLATLRYQTTTIGKAMTNRNPGGNLLLFITLNPSNQIIECYGKSTGMTTAAPNMVMITASYPRVWLENGTSTPWVGNGHTDAQCPAGHTVKFYAISRVLLAQPAPVGGWPMGTYDCKLINPTTIRTTLWNYYGTNQTQITCNALCVSDPS